MKKQILKILATMPILILANIVFVAKTYAVCPVCTGAAVLGIGLSRWLKIDDTVTGLWIGGLIVSSIGWTINWLSKKKIRFYGRKILITVVYYATIIVPLYFTDIIGHPLNTFWGIDKLILGIILGSVGFLIGYIAHLLIKNKKGKILFPFQKVVLPLLPLVILSIIFYFLTKH